MYYFIALYSRLGAVGIVKLEHVWLCPRLDLLFEAEFARFHAQPDATTPRLCCFPREIMSLPVSNQFTIDYAAEKGVCSITIKWISVSWLFSSDKISNFLLTFASKDTELTRDFADIGLNDDDAPTRTKSLKYMQQLVRVHILVYA